MNLIFKNKFDLLKLAQNLPILYLKILYNIYKILRLKTLVDFMRL